jgi:lipoprotein NlpI
MKLSIVSALLVSVFVECQTSTAFSQDRNSGVSIDKLVANAIDAWSAGNYQEAFEAANGICQLKPDDIRYQLFLGDVSFAAGKIDESIAAYDAAIGIQPAIEPRLWQRGLALYYADRFADGVRQFETHQTVNSQDVENAVWHLLCAARLSDVEQAREKLIPITKDPRVPMAEIYEMFAGRMTSDDVMKAARTTSIEIPEDGYGHRLQLYYAWLYIGLHQEMMGQKAASIESLKMAEEQNPLGKTSFMGQVARVHLELRMAAAGKK